MLNAVQEKPEVLSLYEFFKKFPDEESARAFFEVKRWSNGKYCPHCGSISVAECKDHKPMPYRCKDCRKHFSVRTRTTLEESRLPLQKSAWFLAHRIRESWLANKPNDDDKLDGHVEVDETFIVGKEKNKHASKKIKEGRGAVGKFIVVGAKQRNGKVFVEKAVDTSTLTLKSFIRNKITLGANVYTDNFTAYRGLAGYNHRVVNHSVGEYVRQQVHTNGIESFWALLKRGYYGIFHYMSFKHLHRYINEFSFRHNTAAYGTLQFIEATAQRMNNHRLTYKELINA